MNSPNSSKLRGLEDRTFLWLIVLVSILFAWVIVPLHGAILWAVVIAILFVPLHRRLCRAFHQRTNLAAFATLITVVVIVIIPLTVLSTALVAEASVVYEKIQSGDVNVGRYLQQMLDSTPPWATEVLDRFGVANLRGVKEKLSSGLSEASKVV